MKMTCIGCTVKLSTKKNNKKQLNTNLMFWEKCNTWEDCPGGDKSVCYKPDHGDKYCETCSYKRNDAKTSCTVLPVIFYIFCSCITNCFYENT